MTLSCSAARGETCVQSLLHQFSSFVLLAANKTCSETEKIAKIL